MCEQERTRFPAESMPDQDRSATPSERPDYTRDEVRKHNTISDAWVIHRNKVYNISEWYEHPGGAAIFSCSGQDITDVFPAMHSPAAYARMEPLCIGDLVESNEVKEGTKEHRQMEFEKAYRKLRSDLVAMGLFKPLRWYYVYKMASTFALGVVAVYCILFFESAWIHVLGATLLGLYFQQSAWISHDLLHHQVFTNRRYADYWALIWVNVMEGYSMQRWKNKHAEHHAVTNMEDSSPRAQDGDPDLDTMPVLAWSLYQIQLNFDSVAKDTTTGSENKTGQTPSPLIQFLIKHQAYTFFFVLLLARLSWMNESFKVAFELGGPTKNMVLEIQKMGLRYPRLEKVGILAHYLWTAWVTSRFGQWSLWYTAWLYLVMTATCGFFLAVTFVLGHNAMGLYPAGASQRPDFCTLQATTCRHVNTGRGLEKVWWDWFNGAFQNHIDHHLFPLMPRPNLARAHPYIQSFCQEWNVPYHETTMMGGIREILHHLNQVAGDFVLEFVQEGPGMM